MGHNMKKLLTEKILKHLREKKLVDEEKLKKIEEEIQPKSETEAIETLIESRLIYSRDLLELLSLESGIPPIDLSVISVDKEIMDLIPEKVKKRHGVVPLARIGSNITLVVSDPTDIFAIDDVKTVTGCNVELVLATRDDIRGVLQSFYKEGKEDIFADISADLGKSGIEVIIKSENDVIEDNDVTAPIVKIVDLIISEAIKRRASDIHIEPQEKSLRVRYRVDGKLRAIFDLPKKNQNAVIARLKIMSNLDITETRIPQDGRFRLRVEEKEIDFRVSSLPANFGNKIVLRALDKTNLSAGLETLGFLPESLTDFKEALAKPFGIILVTGPTGSGKSTTLYSILNNMNVPGKNIVTVEDPVEYQVQGITQITARPEIGLDFANGLRAILRQSPDVIMVGEIRDFETADIAIKASLTGQMVLSTLHTNDAVGAITRLVNMGIEPFLVASSLVMTCAQRLLRKICPYCKTKVEMEQETIKELSKTYSEICNVKEFYRGAGCPKCNYTGYLGRMGTLETLLVDENIKTMIAKCVSEAEIKDYLKARGVRTLRDNAIQNFIKGLTTLEEALSMT